MQIENRIEHFILANLYFTTDQTLDHAASFLETGVVDSTGIMELVAYVQTEFGVSVRPEEIIVDNFDSICSMAHFIRRKLGASGSENPAPAAPTTRECSTLTNG